MTVNLCERFPSMTPLSLRKERAREVFLLISRYNKYQRKQKKQSGKKKRIRKSDLSLRFLDVLFKIRYVKG